MTRGTSESASGGRSDRDQQILELGNRLNALKAQAAMLSMAQA
jgi:hypothetical protein